MLTHPVISSLLQHKWFHFGLWFYLLNLLIYVIFLGSLTAFALNVVPPQSNTCMCPSAVNVNPLVYQELMNRHGKKERWTSVRILCRITLQNAPYMDYNLLQLTSFEVLLWIPKSPPAETISTCWLINVVGVNMQLTL